VVNPADVRAVVKDPRPVEPLKDGDVWPLKGQRTQGRRQQDDVTEAMGVDDQDAQSLLQIVSRSTMVPCTLYPLSFIH